MGKLPTEARKRASQELARRYRELKLDTRLERLDGAVGEIAKAYLGGLHHCYMRAA